MADPHDLRTRRESRIARAIRTLVVRNHNPQRAHTCLGAQRRHSGLNGLPLVPGRNYGDDTLAQRFSGGLNIQVLPQTPERPS